MVNRGGLGTLSYYGKVASSATDLTDFLRRLRKTELHLHIEGTLEPEMLLGLSRRNRVPVRYRTVDEARAAYRFDDLQSFLNVYYEGAQVLCRERDFFALTWAYLLRAEADGVRHVEIFVDPQQHVARGVPVGSLLRGVHRALERGTAQLGISSGLIACFLRHLPEDDALATLDALLPFREWLVGVGLDSTEVGNPPERFTRVFARAREAGLRVVVHAGEEGPPDYVWQALDLLGAERIDHGVRSLEDPALVARLARDRIPLTVCPLSNVCLGVFDSIEEHNLKRLLDAGLVVCVNSDDPAYFGGYVNDNYRAVHDALGLGRAELAALARHGIEAAFVTDDRRRELLGSSSS